ncbi:unnamed protein product, partial [Oppiella nova]
YALYLANEANRTYIRCPALPRPLNGEKSENTYWPGTIVRFSCDDGYRLVGDEARLCLEDGLCAKGFNDSVCKTITVDESPNIDGTNPVNRRVCLCSDTKEGYGGNAATGEYFPYWFSPGHECIRNGRDRQCKEYCRRIDINDKTSAYGLWAADEIQVLITFMNTTQ